MSKRYNWSKPSIQQLFVDHLKENNDVVSDSLVAAVSHEFDCTVDRSTVHRNFKKFKQKFEETLNNNSSANDMEGIEEARNQILSLVDNFSLVVNSRKKENQSQNESNCLDSMASNNNEPDCQKSRFPGEGYLLVQEYVKDLNTRLKPVLLTINSEQGYYQFAKWNQKSDKERYYCSRCGKSNGIMGIVYRESFYLKANTGTSPYKAWESSRDKAIETEADPFFPPFFQVERNLHKWHNKNISSIKLGSIPEEYSNFPVDSNNIEKRWLLVDSEEVSVFCTDLGLRTLASATVLCGDATFSTCPRPYFQTFYLHAFCGGDSEEEGEWVTPLMAVMNGKQERQYDIIVKAISEGWKRLNIEPIYKRIHLDYENAVQNSFEKLNGKDTVYGCCFHYAKNINEKLRKLKLWSYNLDKKGKYKRIIQRFVRALKALPFLPKEHVSIVWKNCLINEACRPLNVDMYWPEAGLKKLKQYMKNWFRKVKNRWTFWGLRRIRSTNYAENFNGRKNRQYPKKPLLSQFLKNELKCFQGYEYRMDQISRGCKRFKPRKRKYVEFDQKLAKMEEDYMENFNTVR